MTVKKHYEIGIMMPPFHSDLTPITITTIDGHISPASRLDLLIKSCGLSLVAAGIGTVILAEKYAATGKISPAAFLIAAIGLAGTFVFPRGNFRRVHEALRADR
jgi:hypothetical protein